MKTVQKRTSYLRVKVINYYLYPRTSKSPFPELGTHTLVFPSVPASTFAHVLAKLVSLCPGE